MSLDEDIEAPIFAHTALWPSTEAATVKEEEISIRDATKNIVGRNFTGRAILHTWHL